MSEPGHGKLEQRDWIGNINLMARSGPLVYFLVDKTSYHIHSNGGYLLFQRYFSIQTVGITEDTIQLQMGGEKPPN